MKLIKLLKPQPYWKNGKEAKAGEKLIVSNFVAEYCRKHKEAKILEYLGDGRITLKEKEKLKEKYERVIG